MTLLALQRDFIRWLRTGDYQYAERIGGGAGPDIYLNNHRASLMASLRSTFPLLRQWLGDAAFDQAAAHHVEDAVPASWTLDAYGADFAATLAHLHPAQQAAVDLARVEWALAEAFVAADAPVLGIGDLEKIDWEGAVLHLVPGCRCLRLATNADDILLALAADSEPPVMTLLPDPAQILVWRRAFKPRLRRLDQEETWLIGELAMGVRFAHVCALLAGRHEEGEAISRAGNYLARWARDGICETPR